LLFNIPLDVEGLSYYTNVEETETPLQEKYYNIGQ